MQYRTIEVEVPSHYAERLEAFAQIHQCSSSEVITRSLELLFSTYFSRAKEKMTEDEFQALMKQLHNTSDLKQSWSHDFQQLGWKFSK